MLGVRGATQLRPPTARMRRCTYWIEVVPTGSFPVAESSPIPQRRSQENILRAITEHQHRKEKKARLENDGIPSRSTVLSRPCSGHSLASAWMLSGPLLQPMQQIDSSNRRIRPIFIYGPLIRTFQAEPCQRWSTAVQSPREFPGTIHIQDTGICAYNAHGNTRSSTARAIE